MTELKHIMVFESFESNEDLNRDEIEKMFDLNLIDVKAYVEWLVDHGFITDADTAIVEVAALSQNPGIGQNVFTLWHYDGKTDVMKSDKPMRDEVLRKMKETGADFAYIKDIPVLVDDKFRTLHTGKITPFHLAPRPSSAVVPTQADPINEGSTELTREEADHLFDRKMISAETYGRWMIDHDQFTTENTATVALPLIPGKKIRIKFGEQFETAEDPFAGVLRSGLSLPDVADNIKVAVEKMGAEFYYVTNNDSIYTTDGEFLGKQYTDRLDIEIPEVPTMAHSIATDFDQLMKLYDDGLIGAKSLYTELVNNGHMTTDNVAIAYMDEEKVGMGSYFYSIVSFDGREEKTTEDDVLEIAKRMGAKIVCLEYPSTSYSTEGSEIKLVDGTLLADEKPASLVVPKRWVSKKISGTSESRAKTFESFEMDTEKVISKEDLDKMFSVNLISAEAYGEKLVNGDFITPENTMVFVSSPEPTQTVNGYVFFNGEKKPVELQSEDDFYETYAELGKIAKELGAEFVYTQNSEYLYTANGFVMIYSGKIDSVEIPETPMTRYRFVNSKSRREIYQMIISDDADQYSILSQKASDLANRHNIPRNDIYWESY